jgi:hypothetical protein
MIGLAINVLYLLIGVIILCLVVYLALYVVKMFIGVPDIVEKAVWVIVLIIILIGILTLIAGGSGSFRWGRASADPYTPWATAHLQELLGGRYAIKVG